MKGTSLLMIAIAAGSIACNRGAAQTKETAVPPAAEITIVGCVAPSEPAVTNTTNATATKYMLTNARANGADAKQPSTYRLDANDAMLDAEAGHQVEIVAVVEEPDERATGTSGTSTDKAPAPKLNVHTIRMVTALCPK
jgi:hypothetical protein